MPRSEEGVRERLERIEPDERPHQLADQVLALQPRVQAVAGLEHDRHPAVLEDAHRRSVGAFEHVRVEYVGRRAVGDNGAVEAHETVAGAPPTR